VNVAPAVENKTILAGGIRTEPMRRTGDVSERPFSQQRPLQCADQQPDLARRFEGTPAVRSVHPAAAGQQQSAIAQKYQP